MGVRAKLCHKEVVKIGRKTFKATVSGRGCRKKRKDGISRQKPHWGAKAKAKARKNAYANPAFKAYKNALPKANKACAKSTKPFTTGRGACIRKHFKDMNL